MQGNIIELSTKLVYGEEGSDVNRDSFFSFVPLGPLDALLCLSWLCLCVGGRASRGGRCSRVRTVRWNAGHPSTRKGTAFGQTHPHYPPSLRSGCILENCFHASDYFGPFSAIGPTIFYLMQMENHRFPALTGKDVNHCICSERGFSCL